MNDNTRDMITQLRQYHGQPCAQIRDKLQHTGTFNAYFRSIGTLRDNKLMLVILRPQ